MCLRSSDSPTPLDKGGKGFPSFFKGDMGGILFVRLVGEQDTSCTLSRRLPRVGAFAVGALILFAKSAAACANLLIINETH